mgnify:CR=1 FL=1
MELKGSKTEQNLMTAFAGESQARNKYTYFASKAKKEGYEQIAAIFQETADNEVIEEYISVEKSVATPKEEKKIEQPKTQKVQEVQKEETKVENIQPKEEPKVVEIKPEPIKEPEPVIPKCSESNHYIGVGNSNKWFNSKQETINYYQGIIKTWGDKWEKFEIDDETYQKNCPYGYETWSCPLCEKWTINFYYN